MLLEKESLSSWAAALAFSLGCFEGRAYTELPAECWVFRKRDVRLGQPQVGSFMVTRLPLARY